MNHEKADQARINDIVASLVQLGDNINSPVSAKHRIRSRAERHELRKAFFNEYGFDPHSLDQGGLEKEIKSRGLWYLDASLDEKEFDKRYDTFFDLLEKFPTSETRSAEVAEALKVPLKDEEDTRLWKAYIAYEEYQHGTWKPQSSQAETVSLPSNQLRPFIQQAAKLTYEAQTLLIKPYRPALPPNLGEMEVSDLKNKINFNELISDSDDLALYHELEKIHQQLRTPQELGEGLQELSLIDFATYREHMTVGVDISKANQFFREAFSSVDSLATILKSSRSSPTERPGLKNDLKDLSTDKPKFRSGKRQGE